MTTAFAAISRLLFQTAVDVARHATPAKHVSMANAIAVLKRNVETLVSISRQMQNIAADVIRLADKAWLVQILNVLVPPVITIVTAIPAMAVNPKQAVPARQVQHLNAITGRKVQPASVNAAMVQ